MDRFRLVPQVKLVDFFSIQSGRINLHVTGFPQLLISWNKTLCTDQILSTSWAHRRFHGIICRGNLFNNVRGTFSQSMSESVFAHAWRSEFGVCANDFPSQSQLLVSTYLVLFSLLRSTLRIEHMKSDQILVLCCCFDSHNCSMTSTLEFPVPWFFYSSWFLPCIRLTGGNICVPNPWSDGCCGDRW